MPGLGFAYMGWRLHLHLVLWWDLLLLKIIMRIKNEKLFQWFNKGTSTEIGRKQFKDHQSRGIYPKEPDDYFLSLSEGKWWFDWLSSEYRKMYVRGEWWGWKLLCEDWKDDLWVLPHLCKWHHRIPVWVLDMAGVAE